MKILVLSLVMIFAGTGFVWSGDSTIPASSSEPQQMLDFNLAGYGAQGQKTWDVQGAQMDMSGNDIKITDMTAHLYGAKENMVLTSDQGQFDKEAGIVHLKSNVKAVTDSGAQLTTETLDWAQKKQLITSDDQVNITKGNMKAVAIGIEAQPDFKVAKLEKDVVMTIDTDQMTKGVGKESQGTKKSPMVITCDGPMELNYEKQFAVFEKNVKVEGDATQGTMTADQMTVYFGQTSKQIDKMVAQGHVKIVRGENISMSDGAVFTASDKKLLLTGRPKLVLYTEEGMNVSP